MDSTDSLNTPAPQPQPNNEAASKTPESYHSDNSVYQEWRTKVTTTYKYTKDKFDKEAKKYIQAYRNEFAGILPERLINSDRVDINVVYQTVKMLLPILYFKNPQVFIKSQQEKIIKKITEEVKLPSGEPLSIPIIDPMTGHPMQQEFDGPRSALILQSSLNENIVKAGVKEEVKASIEDALLTFYGAIKCGWGNDQGVASMGPGAPPSIREDIYDDSAYAMRLPPWDVIVDSTNFYHPQWIAVRYLVIPDQLKNDSRLSNTADIKGVTKLNDPRLERAFSGDPKKDVKMTEYFEVFVKPSATYPQGKYFMFTEEVKTGFLFEDVWPIKSKTFPVKILYFNRDPEGGMPVPDIRYFYGHQKAKLNLRNAEYEWVQRTMPALYLNEGGMKNAETVKKQIQSGQMPRVITGSQQADRAFGMVQFPPIPADFRLLHAGVDNDIARVVGLLGPVTPTNSDQLATGLKIANSAEQVRQQERVDCVTDFVREILTHWVDLYKEFAGPDNYALIDGETFPVQWGKDEIQGKFNLEVKPFSMTYEDPVLRRRQWIDLLNLLANPAIQTWLKEQGFEVDVAKIVKRILETYDERDISTFVVSTQVDPEMQVMEALRENELMAQGKGNSVAVLPTDNDKVHILLHSLMGPVMAEHILQHREKMMGIQPQQGPGGGNPEGLPLNGGAANQEMLQKPLNPSVANQKVAMEREANKPVKTR